MPMRLLLSVLFALSSILPALSQQLQFGTNTKFVDGVYASYEDFVNNKPSYPTGSFKIKWKETIFFNALKMKSFKTNIDGKWKKVDGKKVWGICVNGVPYIQYSIHVPYQIEFGNKAVKSEGKYAFSRIRILGNLCHFNIEDVYPRQRNRFRSEQFIEESQGRMVHAQRLLQLSSGRVYEYDEYVFSQLIKDDEYLASQFNNETDRENKLFIYLQKYNKRNPLGRDITLARK